ncbi:hypothetical protein JOF56_003932 [Kibdelosporangium banguiense]|uniref:Methyltransferase domain-containing protein n=1 Tax=Kibdelosporangium banguiense TaxID=1365924 RepID=A0ABS4TGJ6_9PSEU|nr:mycofactocin oligosaccharide methyltransferase MftM [Kibdelosporangium banguiense]MBP2323547.1 hypothetical protein [Kibdelosporangium banguiense]
MHTIDIDPLAPGPYQDDLVEVVREDPATGPRRVPPIVRTEHFCLRRCDRRLEVSHWLKPEQLDADLGGLLAEELFAPGWLTGASVFERVYIGVARSIGNDPLQSWITFYDNTLTRIHDHWRVSERDPRHSWIAEHAVVWRRALQLVPAGEVLDLGSCWGFLPLLLAERARNTVTAADISSGAMRLLAAAAARRETPLRTLVCDAASVPLPDDAVDTVTVIHLLEHLDDKEAHDVLREAVRLARRRVVVAVGFDEEPTAACGQVRSFSHDKLTEMGLRTGKRFDAEAYHCGWLVIHAD